MDQSRITHCIELLCQKGCKDVARTILALERDELATEMQGLDTNECHAVLTELKAIMAVYKKGNAPG